MSKYNIRNVSTNIPSARTTKSAVTFTTRMSLSKGTDSETNSEFFDYNKFDMKRKEILSKEESSRRVWSVKFDPWLTDQYRKMYEEIALNRGVSIDRHQPSLERPEWQQSPNVIPPLCKRLAGQRRRRILGSFPQTENDKIGWRLLPEQAIETLGSSALQRTTKLPQHYKLSYWPVESFY